MPPNLILLFFKILPLKESAIETGARVLGPIPQGTFLENLGIKSRADFLKKKSTHKQAKEINNAYHRLVDSEDMGFLFQVLCISSPNSKLNKPLRYPVDK